MKLLFASDIHGSNYYLNKLVDAIDKEKPDKIVLLGDLLYHGPRNDLPLGYEPKKVIDLLNSYKEKIICVRGNCDTEVDQMVLNFPILSDYLNIFIDNLNIFVTHGHKFNKDNLQPLSKDDILIYGHTHIPLNTIVDNIICLNPGSISIPKENSPHSFLIYENKKFIWKTIDGQEYMNTIL